MKKLQPCDTYVCSNRNKINNRYRHTFHVMPPIGWMNDPNGFCFAFDKYHLLYQYNPYAAKWGPMHWGHYTTSDFIKWEELPIALSPDMPYDIDFGAFSGSALFEDNVLKLFYTGTIMPEGMPEQQQQCLATSSDGINFIKFEGNPIIKTEQIPEGYNKVAFRDPKVFKKGETYYCLIGAKHEESGGQILMYKSSDLISWELAGPMIQSALTKGVLECNDYFNLGSTEVLISSPQLLMSIKNKHQNVHSNIYMTGCLNFSDGSFAYDYFDDIDSGFDFYAAQTLASQDGRQIMTAWMNMWDRNYPTANDGWVGAMILPRELTLHNGRLYQQPVRELENYRKNKIEISGAVVQAGKEISFKGVCGDTVDLIVEADVNDCAKFGVKVFADSENETLIYFDKETEQVTLDRSQSGIAISGNMSESIYDSFRRTKITVENGLLKMRIILDVSCAEVFLQDGERTLTANIYPSNKAKGIFFYSCGGNAIIKKLEKYDIEVSEDA